jgi:hypothetical protein
VLFALVLVQLMVTFDVLIVENYRTMDALGLSGTLVAIGLPYMASAFGIFLLRQTFKTVPKESSTRRRAYRGARRCKCCGRCTFRSRSRCISPVSYHWMRAGIK